MVVTCEEVRLSDSCARVRPCTPCVSAPRRLFTVTPRVQNIPNMKLTSRFATSHAPASDASDESDEQASPEEATRADRGDVPIRKRRKLCSSR